MGPLGAGLVVAGNMMGSGVYLLPATLGSVGSIAMISWLIALGGALVLSLGFSLLSVLRPSDPGLTGYITAALGKRAGFYTSYIYWISVVLGNVAIAIAAASYLARLLPFGDAPAMIQLLAIALICLCTVLNLAGADIVARYCGLSLVLGLAPVFLLCTLGWYWFDPDIFRASWNVTGRSDSSAVILALSPIAWAFLGFESAGATASVIRNPARNVPLATLLGVFISGVIYLTMCTAITGLVPAKELAASSAPLADVAIKLWGRWAGILIAACAAIKAFGTLAGWTLVGAETGVSAGQIGLFPRFGSNARRSLFAYLIIGAIIMAISTVISTSATIGEQFGIVINSTTILCLIVYACASFALIRFATGLARSRMRSLAVGAGAVSILLCVALIATFDLALLVFAGGVLASGLLVRMAVRGRQRAAS